MLGNHVTNNVAVNIIIVMGSTGLNAELTKRYGTVKTSLGEPISVVLLDKSDGVVARDDVFMQHTREAMIKEYFFGDTKRTLSPLIQQVDFDNIVVYKAPSRTFVSPNLPPLLTNERATLPLSQIKGYPLLQT